MGWERICFSGVEFEDQRYLKKYLRRDLVGRVIYGYCQTNDEKFEKPTPTVPELKKSQKIIIHEKLKNIFISKVFFPVNIEDTTMNRYRLENQSNHNILVLRGGTLYCCTIFKCYYRRTKHCTVLTGLH